MSYALDDRIDDIEANEIVVEDYAQYACPDCGELFDDPRSAALCCFDERGDFDRRVDIAYEQWRESQWGL